MASLTGQLVAETYKALLKLIDNDILTASEKQITDGFGGGSNVFIDSQGFLRANKYKITNGLATQFLKADGSLDSNAYLTSITGAQVIAALGYTPVPTTRTITINGETHNLAADNSWTVGGTSAIWGNITGTLSNQTDLQNALNAKYNNPTGTISQYIRGDGTLATFPTMPGGLPTGGSAGQILAKIDATDYNTHWIDNYATQTKNEVKLGQTLTKGTPVYVSSANGTNMIVSRASNTSEALSSKTFGLLESGGATNDIVKCVTFGLIAGLDTSTAQAGDPVWLGVNGALIFGLANKPFAPAHLVYIGVVTRVQQNNGEIFVNIQNGFELKEIHDVYIADPANNHGLFYDIADGLWKNKSIAGALGYTPQAQLSGTGFVKASGTTITYDNSTYLTTTDAASTYQRLDKMVSNLLPSATEYPNSNAVIAALALKADAANPVFSGNMTISGAEPKLYFTDTDQNPDYFIGVDAGFFRVYDQTASATRFVINSDGNISTGVGKSITAGSFIKDGGTATQFLKADGSVDSTDYATVASLANYLLSATAASTYQTLANLSTDLTASATKYPSVNAVNAGLSTKQPLDADLTAIAGLTGTSGFLKKTAADTWTLDTSTYLTTGEASTTYLAITTAASTYQRLDKMVSNLLPSSTEYPNSNAVINALALKANAANPVFTGDLSISGATPRLYFVDTDQNPDYTVFIDSGFFYIYDQTAGATRFSINSSGNISTGVGKSITAGSFIKENGTASQFLMADGSVSTGPANGITGSLTTGYIPKATGANTLGNSAIYDNGTSILIGTTTQDNNVLLNVNGNTRSLQFRSIIDGSDTIYTGGYYQQSVSGTTYAFAQQMGASGQIRWWTYNPTNSFVNHLTLTNSGNLLVGTTTDDGNKLNINGNGRVNGLLTVGANTAAGLFSVTPSGTATRKIVLFSGADNNFQFYGFGVESQTLVYSTYTTGDDHVFFAGTGTTTRNELARIKGTGGANFNGKVQINADWGGTNPERFSIRGSYPSIALRSTLHNQNWLIHNDPNLRFYNATGVDSDSWQLKTTMFANGNVLIGTSTTDAGYKLDVIGQARFGGSNTYNGFIIGSHTNDFGGAIYTKGVSAQTMYADNSSTVLNAEVNLYLRTGNIDRLTISSTGTASFTNYVKAITQNSYEQFHAGAFEAVASTNSNMYTQIGTHSTGYGWIQVLEQGVAYRNLILNAAGGNVGIGTTVATALLTVAGTTDLAWSASTSKLQISRSGTLARLQNYDNGSVANIALSWEGGNVLIGTQTDTGYKLFVNGSLKVGTGGGSNGSIVNISGGSYNQFNLTYNNTWGLLMGYGDGSISGGYHGLNVAAIINVQNASLVLGTNNAAQMTITGSGATTFASSVTATSFFESSDMRLKTLIESNPIIEGIEKLEAKLYEKNGKIELGYFAQDAEKIMPYAVTKNADGFLNLSYREIHTAKIARLEKEVAELKEKLNVA